jgi:hypothetical protein
MDVCERWLVSTNNANPLAIITTIALDVACCFDPCSVSMELKVETLPTRRCSATASRVHHARSASTLGPAVVGRRAPTSLAARSPTTLPRVRTTCSMSMVLELAMHRLQFSTTPTHRRPPVVVALVRRRAHSSCATTRTSIRCNPSLSRRALPIVCNRTPVVRCNCKLFALYCTCTLALSRSRSLSRSLSLLHRLHIFNTE